MIPVQNNRVKLKRQEGFTLLEILVAIAMFGVIISTVLASYTGTFKIVDETEYQADIYEMSRIVLDRICQDLESAYMKGGEEVSGAGDEIRENMRFVGEVKETTGVGLNILRFLSRAHLVFDEEDSGCGIAELVYYLAEDKEGDGLALYRSDTPEFRESPEDGSEGLILCQGLYSVNFTFYDTKGDAHETWDSRTDEFKDKLPARVTVELLFLNRANPESHYRFMAGVSLPLARKKYEKAT
ncbi:MAG: type II secretion system protein [Desulfatiglans sp.]|jgi:general secretion pathway protein J|nr:type II secretion system protein [Desulfatiglans sp.]